VVVAELEAVVAVVEAVIDTLDACPSGCESLQAAAVIAAAVMSARDRRMVGPLRIRV
jgi:hypothetical protein